MLQQVSQNIFAFISQGDGSNVFLVKGNKETALIDSSTLPNAGSMLAGLSKTGIKPGDISLILHTHGHADHMGCDHFFSSASIAMHSADATEINAGNKEFACAGFFPGASLPKISQSLEDLQEIDLGGFSLKVLHTPGHTAGSICFLEPKQKLLFSGDTLFLHGFGRTDLPSGDSQKLLDSLKKLQKLGFSALLPGHGPVLKGKKGNSLNLQGIVEIASTNAFL